MSDQLFYILEAICLSMMFIIAMVSRSVGVRMYRTNVFTAVAMKNVEDSMADKTYAYSQKRWEEVERVSYRRMFWMFWRPLSSFYDRDFLKDIGIK